MFDDFFAQTTLISYSAEQFEQHACSTMNHIQLNLDDKIKRWLNTYGLTHLSAFQNIISDNQLDDFLLTLLRQDEHNNKVIELNNLLFIALKVLKPDSESVDSEQMFFVLSPQFLWSIQEEQGTHFEWIRQRLAQDKGLVREKGIDYLLFLLIESLINNYETTFEHMVDINSDFLHFSKIEPKPAFTERIEAYKRHLLIFKKSVLSLRNTIIKLENIDNIEIESKYFTETKEQANNLLTDVDFELQELDSKMNLIFSIQGYRLNEIMQTLTVISVVFMPLTFIVGIYGMNFDNMPELKWQYGYFTILGLMVLSTLAIIRYFKKKHWL